MNDTGQDTRNTNINIRARMEQRDLIDRAAQQAGKSRSEFMLETAYREAQSILLDRRHFSLDNQDYDAFIAALDAPTLPNPALKELLSRQPVWEK